MPHADPPSDPHRSRKVADEELSLRLLAGFRMKNGSPTKGEFPKHNSFEERQARAALARIVRDHVPGFSGELLALAIDPLTPSKIPGMKPARRVAFTSPARGRSSTWARDMFVIDHIRQRTTMFNTEDKEDAALKSAENRFDLTHATVKSIWGKYKKSVGRRTGRKK
jgi:hypothetical protein